VTRWPALAYEDRPWSSSTLNEAHLSVYERIRVSRPYQAAVPPLVAGLEVHLAPETLDLQEQAVAEIVRFDTQMANLPVPMPAILLRTESASSSQIEHLTSNARNIALAELGAGSKDNAALIVANSRAMLAALNAGDQVDAKTVLAVHQTLLGSSDPGGAGRWRDVQVWVGSSGRYPHGADFIPPHADRVPELIEDLQVPDHQIGVLEGVGRRPDEQRISKDVAHVARRHQRDDHQEHGQQGRRQADQAGDDLPAQVGAADAGRRLSPETRARVWT